MMSSISEPGVALHRLSLWAWLPLFGLPITVAVVGAHWPPWVRMWGLAASLFFGCKWLTLLEGTAAWSACWSRILGYLLLWPGMNAKSFLAPTPTVRRPAAADWFWAATQVGLGMALIFGVTPLAMNWNEYLAGWVGMVGIIFVLHFGLFHLLSLVWRRAGVNAPAIMDAPVKAASLGEFWGRRWNRAFRDLAHAYLFRPLVRRYGITAATTAVFLASGVIHDLVISVPAEAGYGLPITYFLIQGLGVLAERHPWGRRLGLGEGRVGRLFCAVVTVGPVFLLFHPPFVRRVVLPMLRVVGCL